MNAGSGSTGPAGAGAVVEEDAVTAVPAGAGAVVGEVGPGAVVGEVAAGSVVGEVAAGSVVVGGPAGLAVTAEGGEPELGGALRRDVSEQLAPPSDTPTSTTAVVTDRSSTLMEDTGRATDLGPAPTAGVSPARWGTCNQPGGSQRHTPYHGVSGAGPQVIETPPQGVIVKDGEASVTARRVAAQRVSFTRVAAPYGRPEADQRLQTDVAGDLEGVETPMTRYLRGRTRFFDRVVVDSIGGGTDQVVIVGAGYDGRSLRYGKSGVRWFELDHRDTQADKRSRLDRLDIATAAIGFAAVDFGVDDVGASLRGVGHDPTRATLFACEGVAGYLSAGVLSSLLRALDGCAAPGSTLALDIPLRPESPSEQSRRSLLQSAVAGMGEPLVFAMPRDELDPFMMAAGWRVVDATDPAGQELETSARSTAFVTAAPVG